MNESVRFKPKDTPKGRRHNGVQLELLREVASREAQGANVLIQITIEETRVSLSFALRPIDRAVGKFPDCPVGTVEVPLDEHVTIESIISQIRPSLSDDGPDSNWGHY